MMDRYWFQRNFVGGALAGLSLALLAGCNTPKPIPPKPAPPVAASAPAPHVEPAPVEPPPPPPPPVSPLAAEARWLTELFGATPVGVRTDGDGSVVVNVPMVHAFDAAGSTPKPAIKAVVDRLAQSLGRQPKARLQLAVPQPSTRLQALRAYAQSKSVAAWRLSGSATASTSETVEFRLLPAVAVVRKVDDAALPPAPRGSVRAPAPRAAASQPR